MDPENDTDANDDDQIVEQTPEQLKEEEDAMDAGFAEARGEEPPTTDDQDIPSENKQGNGEQTGDDDDDTATDEGVEPGSVDKTADNDDEDNDKPITLTKRQMDEINSSLEAVRTLQESFNELGDFKNMTKEQIDKIHGKFGEINRNLKERTGNVKLSKDSFKRLGEEFGDIAELLAEDLSEVIPASPGIDMDELMTGINEKLDGRVSEAVSTITDQMNEKFLNHISPGWDGKIESDTFVSYLKTLPGTEQKKITDSNDPLFIAETINNFDAWTKKREQAAQEQRDKKQLLEENLEQKGGKSPAQSIDDEEAAMEAGFKKVQSTRL